MFKLETLLIIYSVKTHIETKSKQRWYYSKLSFNVAKGFTLAEVLITLLVIGVVCSLVIPAVIQDIQMQEFKVAWKKTFAELNQATKRIMIDNGGTIKYLCTNNHPKCYRDKFLPYLNYTKICESADAEGNCWVYHDDMKFLNGDTIPVGWGVDSPSIVLSNGSSINFFSFSTDDCSRTTWGNPMGKPVCGFFFVDVNGFKKPNTIGKDIYSAFLIENMILPTGTQGDGYYPTSESCTSSGEGQGCSAQYLY